jgi:large subunit ribosomal protein L18e|tara:strand:- start:73 stop:450 length:378 start_codon:yes stop_codon:yes gene_type:complete
MIFRMATRTGATNDGMKTLIVELLKKASTDKIPLWKRVASDLSKPTRQRRIVNLSRINRFTKENETIVVPGKVLGDGLLDHKVTVAAFSFSQNAIDKMTKVQAKAISINELMKEDIKGKKVKIIG